MFVDISDLERNTQGRDNSLDESVFVYLVRRIPKYETSVNTMWGLQKKKSLIYLNLLQKS